MTDASSGMRDDVAEFLRHLAARQLSVHTVAAYGRDLRDLAAFCESEHISQWRALDSEGLRRFIAQRHRDNELSGKTLRRRLSACRALFRWLIANGRADYDPALRLRAPKSPQRLPETLDVDEAQRLVELPENNELGGELDARDRALLELFYSSGLRLSELCGLRWQDIDLSEGMARVLGKGNKTRVVPVGRHARAALRRWREESAPAADAPIFPGRGGATIRPRTVQLRLKLLAQRQGIWKNVYPHLLRHSCASHVLESSGDLRGVQELLGHADIGTTQIYTHLDYQYLARVYDAAHPRAKRKT